jgi:chaperonin GroEL
MKKTLSPNTHFNALSNEEFKIYDILSAVSSILGRTFGPHGSTTIIEDRNLRHVATKDGYTVLKSLYSNDDLERVVLEFVKRMSMRLVRTVGDGSTSAVIVAEAFASRLRKFQDKHPEIHPGDLAAALNAVSKEIQICIKEMSEPITENSDALVEVCRIATNNDQEVSELIADCFKRSSRFGMLQVEVSDRAKTEVEYKDGYEMYRGFVDPMFVNRKKDDREYCELENVYVLMYEGVLGAGNIEAVGKILDWAVNLKKGSLMVIASGYDNAFSDFIHSNVLRMKGHLPICICEHGTGTTAGRNHFFDASVYLNADVVRYSTRGLTLESIIESTTDFSELLGFTRRAVITDSNARFFEGAGVGSCAFTALKKSLEDQLAELGASETKFDYDSQIGALKVRYGRLTGSTAVIHVGGSSKAETQAKSFLVEDASLAAKSALLYGVVPAGNISVPLILSDKSNIEEIAMNVCEENDGAVPFDRVYELLEIIRDAYIEVFSKVSKLSVRQVRKMLKRDEIFNIRTRQFEAVDSTTALNPSQTDIEIIQGAMSVMGLVGTSNQFVFCPKNY